MDGALSAALKNQIAEGQKTGAGFKECAYFAVVQELVTVLNMTLMKEHVKNRLKTLKTTYRTLNSIINLSGFGWDETICKLSLHLEHQRFFSKRYPLYEDMKALPPYSASWWSSSTPALDASIGYSDSSPIRGPSASGGKKSKKRPNAALLSELQVVSSSLNRVADAIITIGEVHSLPDLKDAVLEIGGFPRGDLVDVYVYLLGHHKVMAKDKFYVVFKGRQVGIFKSWADCHLQVNKYSGASYRSYATRKEAEAALNAYIESHEDLKDKREEDIHNVPWFLGLAIGVELGIKMVADAKITTSEVHSLPDLKDAVLNIDGFARVAFNAKKNVLHYRSRLSITEPMVFWPLQQMIWFSVCLMLWLNGWFANLKVIPTILLICVSVMMGTVRTISTFTDYLKG
ncbi:uncharacterized protein LOC143891177 [Tasmannia lanceolata]|uniref:uncharacterized protein LOC143891177 n=1 Tax=Tasmannia lanceolata TaxID=3420 RepID=UPI004063A466